MRIALYIITQCQASLKEEQPTNLIEADVWVMGRAHSWTAEWTRVVQKTGAENAGVASQSSHWLYHIFTFACFVFLQHVRTLSSSQPLFWATLMGSINDQWIHQPVFSWQCHFHLATSSTAPRQNLPPVPFLPPPAAPGMHRPSAPPPAGRGQILDATWGAPQRPATPAPLWAPLRVFELRDGGNNKGWAEEVCWWVQTVKSSETWVQRYNLQKWRYNTK
jgi:hypothetical protein